MYIHHVTSDQKVFNKPVMLGLGVGSQRMERINSKNENIYMFVIYFVWEQKYFIKERMEMCIVNPVIIKK